MIKTLFTTICFMALTSSFANADNYEKKTAPLMTPWGEQLTVEDTWTEYPRPQLVRDDWMNLNGLWQYFKRKNSIDLSYEASEGAFKTPILVPFAPESALSGIMDKDASTNTKSTHMYRRTFELPAEYAGKRIMLNFGAVDWRCKVYVNGKEAGMHQGGSDPFSIDITDFLNASGEQEVQVAVYDPSNYGGQPCGKQAVSPIATYYTATSGIWQTVWLEPVGTAYVERYELMPDIDKSQVGVKVLCNDPDALCDITIFDGTNRVSYLEKVTVGEVHTLSIPNAKLWSPDKPNLYNLQISIYQNGNCTDCAKGYLGMRKYSRGMVNGRPAFLLNNEPLYLYGPLDQGWWPDGLLTPPSYEGMIYDLKTIKEDFGMNMVRKHIKVEPDLWYEWCDRNGLIVLQDMPSGGTSGEIGTHQYILNNFYNECENITNALKQHPCIAAWIPFNESWGQNYDEGMSHTKRGITTVRKADADLSRLMYPVTGWYDIEMGDFIDVHSYPAPNTAENPVNERIASCGEFGGIALNLYDHLWEKSDEGYTHADTPEEYTEKYNDFTYQLQKLQLSKGLWASVYTQITDVENEINGLMTYDRKAFKMNDEQKASIRENIQRTINYRYMGIKALVPAGDNDANINWQYTTTQPSGNWMNQDFNDSAWATGKGAFGDGSLYTRTSWKSDDIWLRRTFTLNLDESQRGDISLWMFYDDNVEVYLNGIRIFQREGWNTEYEGFTIPQEGLNALHLDGKENLLAIHCHQSWGGQYIDAGLGIINYVPNSQLEVKPMTENVTPEIKEVEGKAHLMTYSTANGGVHYAYSKDGARWSNIMGGNDIMTNNDLGAPYIRKVKDEYHLICASNDNTQGLYHWQSNDLIHWQTTEGTNSPFISLGDGREIFTPEFYFDEGNNTYYIYYTTKINDKYSFYCTSTKDWKSFTTPRLYFDPGYSAQDLHIEKQGGKFYAYFYSEDNNLRRAEDTSIRPVGTKFSTVTRILQNETLKVRNPATYPTLDNEGYFLAYSYVNDASFELSATTDVENHKWRILDIDQVQFPAGMTHCSVINITDDQLIDIQKAYNGNNTALIPTAETTPEEWAYTFSVTGLKWRGMSYDDTSWQRGVAGFGSGKLSFEQINTPWESSNIYLRRKFNLTGYTPAEMQQISGRIHVKGDAVVYVNGTQATRVSTTDYYQDIQFTENITNKLTPDDNNLIVISVIGTEGAQYIDFGLNIYPENITGITTIREDATSTHATGTYNLNGQKVTRTYRGIVIENGRKTLNTHSW
ncbi:MAG: family 43 glycosylhydrolase [Prevotellaceae bacterium]|nr:family 43 glycosylhydrolase [Prevotellaceae bacterium]